MKNSLNSATFNFSGDCATFTPGMRGGGISAELCPLAIDLAGTDDASMKPGPLPASDSGVAPPVMLATYEIILLPATSDNIFVLYSSDLSVSTHGKYSIEEVSI